MSTEREVIESAAKRLRDKHRSSVSVELTCRAYGPDCDAKDETSYSVWIRTGGAFKEGRTLDDAIQAAERECHHNIRTRRAKLREELARLDAEEQREEVAL